MARRSEAIGHSMAEEVYTGCQSSVCRRWSLRDAPTNPAPVTPQNLRGHRVSRLESYVQESRPAEARRWSAAGGRHQESSPPDASSGGVFAADAAYEARAVDPPSLPAETRSAD